MINLKTLRLERKLSQQKLAEQFGITQQAIFNYENDITEPDIYMLKQLATFFHTTVDYLIGHSDNPTIPNNEFLFTKDTNYSKESHHLALYRQLSSDVQEHLDTLLEDLLSINNSDITPPKTK